MHAAYLTCHACAVLHINGCCSRHCSQHALFVLQAMARLWRVAHFVLNDFLDMPLPTASAAGHSASGWGPAHGGRSRQERQPSSPSQPQPAGALAMVLLIVSLGARVSLVLPPGRLLLLRAREAYMLIA
jgi:hypothetical protein